MAKIELSPEGYTACGKWRLVPSEYMESLTLPNPPADLFEPDDADGWIPWGGGECPIADGVLHQRRYRKGDGGIVKTASNTDWGHDPICPDYDIIAYRIVGK